MYSLQKTETTDFTDYTDAFDFRYNIEIIDIDTSNVKIRRAG